MKTTFEKLLFTVCLLVPMGSTFAEPPQSSASASAQIVALDECDPQSFNAVLGQDFCRNVALGALGFSTTLQDLFAKAAAGAPDTGWDFEPDVLRLKAGAALSIVNRGGEPHTFTEVKTFGGGFINGLNNGQETVPECSGGFTNVDVAKTRIIQGSHIDMTNLSKGEHHFQCCIHPWMRVTVNVN